MSRIPAGDLLRWAEPGYASLEALLEDAATEAVYGAVGTQTPKARSEGLTRAQSASYRRHMRKHNLQPNPQTIQQLTDSEKWAELTKTLQSIQADLQLIKGRLPA